MSNANAVLEWLQALDRQQLPEIIHALLLLEKNFKSAHLDGSALLGNWQLTLIGGKQSLGQSSPRSGKLLPRWLRIQQIYQAAPADATQSERDHGQIRNQVQVGQLTFELSGPWKFYPKPQILAFDFVTVQISFLGKTLLQRPIRGGQEAAEEFWTQPIKDLAFFRFFWITPQAIAARGRGGGIALWRKVDSSAEGL